MSNSPIILPNVDAMLEDALSILRTEIVQFKTKVQQGRALNPVEAKILQGYIKSLVDLSKEERDRAKDADLGDMTMDQLMELIQSKQHQKQLKGK